MLPKTVRMLRNTPHVGAVTVDERSCGNAAWSASAAKITHCSVESFAHLGVDVYCRWYLREVNAMLVKV
jgi:hypothetical protein